MARSKIESHEKIEHVAKAEFLEKGFEKASMRSIASKVGLTQSALYRHYKSKEDMFEQIVSPALQALEDLTHNHIKRQYGMIGKYDTNELFKDNNVEMIKTLLYKYKDELKLILSCSQGTKYENFVHYFVTKQEEGMMDAFKFLKGKGQSVLDISKEEMHVLLSAYTTAIMEPIVHDWPLEKILHNLNIIEKFFMVGFKDIMGFK